MQNGRYSRQTILKDFGIEGQKRLSNASVLVIGAGGLGGPVLKYLTAAGIGRLGVMDYDIVELHNLHRQVHFDEDDLGKTKVEAIAAKLKRLNPDIEIIEHNCQLTSENALSVFEKYDLVVDGSDNFPTRYLVNDAAVLSGIPLVYGAIHQFEGQVSVFNFNDGPNYRDLFPVPPAPGQVPNCAEAGVLGVLPGIIGTMQANEAIKILTKIGEPLSGRLLIYDTKDNSMMKLKIEKNADNPLTGDQPTQKGLIDYDSFCGINDPEEVIQLAAAEYLFWKKENRSFDIIDVREKIEYQGFNIGGPNYPLSEFKDHLDKVAVDKNVVVVCQSGKRSVTAIQLLKEHHGSNNFYNLRGGLIALERVKFKQA